MEIDINKELEHKKESWDKVRVYRINSSKRYENHNKKWTFLFFFMNFLAIMLFIYSINNNILSVFNVQISTLYLSGIASIYIILIQYLISLKQYKYKSQIFQENEIEIEKIIVKLKCIYRSTEDNKEEKFKVIQDEYNEMLKHYPNHQEIDQIDFKTKKGRYSFLYTKEYLFYYINFILTIILIIGVLINLMKV